MKRFILILILLMCFRSSPAPGFIQLPILLSNDLSGSAIKYEMAKYNIEHSDIVFAQIMLETGYLTSRFCKEGNNLFGMKYPRKRQTKAISQDNSMSVYRTWQESIEDYAIWQKQFYKGGDYFAFLQGRYAEDKKYIGKLKIIL